MSYRLNCPQCNAKLKYTSRLFGKAVDCPRCRLTIVLPDEGEPQASEAPQEAILVDNDVVVDNWENEDSPNDPVLPLAKLVEPAEHASTEVTTPKPLRKKKKKKAKKASFLARMPSVAVDPNIIKIVLGVLVLGLLIGGIVYALKPKPAPSLPEETWAPFEVAGQFRALFPGEPKLITQNVMGINFRYYQVQPNRDSIFGVGLMDGSLPEPRRSLPVEELLNDSCNGALANLEKMGGTEISRTSIKLGDYPGKEMEIDAPEGKGRMIFRNYLAGQKLYIVMVGGKGLTADHPDVKKMMDSFAILERSSK